MGELYDTIGASYTRFRRPDARIGSSILRALADSASVVNVGAGAGSYEPTDRRVVAVEPSLTMIRQRPRSSAPVVRGSGCALPFRDGVAEASLAILTLHHWPDPRKGLQELRRVARRRVVILTWDPDFSGFWLLDYFPEILELDRRTMPSLGTLEHELGRTATLDVPIPHDCSDGFLGAYWRRPQAYLDASVRSAISTFAKIRRVDEGVARLTRDLESGEWQRRYGALLGRGSLDLGYRLVVAA